jgi:hypothetical protein
MQLSKLARQQELSKSDMGRALRGAKGLSLPEK